MPSEEFFNMEIHKNFLLIIFASAKPFFLFSQPYTFTSKCISLEKKGKNENNIVEKCKSASRNTARLFTYQEKKNETAG